VEKVALCLARVLVDEPGRVEAEEFEDDGVKVVELTVAPSDRGRVIGRHGRTADALRTIIDAIGRRRGQEYDLEIRG
jgi:predicted RNA-binding protein YlqC (UPF0109 family)